MSKSYKVTGQRVKWKCKIKSEWVSPRAHAEGEEVGADVADPHGLAQVVLHDRHLLGRALGAQQPPAVPAVVPPRRQSELRLELFKYKYFS